VLLTLFCNYIHRPTYSELALLMAFLHMKARKCSDYSFEGSCEHDNELLGFIKVQGFLNQLSRYYHLGRYSAP
jgi:hypothetical protein